MNLNPNIRKLVALLNENGFRTTDSGDGATHDYACDRDHAYVVSVVEPALLVQRAHELVTLLAANGVTLGPMSEDATPCVQASYDPLNGFAILDLMHVTDDMLAPDPA